MRTQVATLRIGRGLRLSLTLLALMALPALAQESVTGAWVFSVDSPDGLFEITLVLAQDGSAVTGTADLVMVEGAEISDGHYEDGTLSFLLHIGFDGQSLAVEVEATVDGDEMVGEASVPDMGALPFTAKRSSGG